MRPKDELGHYGEDLAAEHLAQAGFELLARNWRCRDGELDIVARDGNAIVFVEVKARSSADFGMPAEAVGHVKARRIRGLACRWLAENRPAGAPELRFDVVSVLRQPGRSPELVHLRDAF
ncbi:MAG: YraN family protein [Actinobacteria bacterium]|nr:YraN family protein [Actinomycetota bacterium]MCA1720864.1 YraN family protein [Actinomycetota bacterium]